MYKRFLKRVLDCIISGLAIIILFPLLTILTIIGIVEMKGNPFFTQERVGKDEKEFKLIKFRSMTNEKDSSGKLLPDKDRLVKYGRLLRATSLDELPELINILKGDMSIIGPRPLSVKYLPYYTIQEHHRHDVRPGLTGLAQVNGRNNLSWEEKFAYDLEYIRSLSFIFDMKIFIKTIIKVFAHEGIGQGEAMPMSLYDERKDWKLTEKGAEKLNSVLK